MAGIRLTLANLVVRLLLRLRRHNHQWSEWIITKHDQFNVYRGDFLAIKGIRRGCLTCGREETRWGDIWVRLLKEGRLYIAEQRKRGQHA